MRVAALALAALFVCQALWASSRDSVTIDEFVHLPVGLHALYTGDFRQDPMNPHLPRMWAALALLPSAPAFNPPPGPSPWSLGYYFEYANAADYQRLFARARAMIVLLAVALMVLVWRWTRLLYGEAAALAAVFLFALAPSMLADGHLVTLDMAGAFGFFATTYAVWRLLETPSLSRAVWTGAVLGFATLLKLSVFVLWAVVPVLIAVRAASERERGPSAPRWVLLLVLVGAAGLTVLNAGYAFDGSFALLGAAHLAPAGILARLAAAAPWLRLPLPLPFVDGVDMIPNVGKAHEPSYFLAGELSADGWWYYHLAAFALKTPLPMLGLAILATGRWLLGRSGGRRDYCLFVPVVFLFAANSLFNSLDIGVRHVLPVYPLLYVAAGPLVARGLTVWRRPARDGRTTAAATAALLLWYAAGTWASAPRYLQYCNEIAGGPQGGHRWLIDSNLDWGQDLIRLGEAMRERGWQRVSLAYFGRVDPHIYGIDFQPLERGLSHGPTAVSASFLMGRPYFWFHGGRMGWVPSRTYTWLQQQEPVGRAGSLFLYDLP